MPKHEMTGAARITRERKRQIEKEGWTFEHDDQHQSGELAMAAACYAAPREILERIETGDHVWLTDPWPWADWAKHEDDRIRQLEIAGALCAAEIDRLLRAKKR